MHRRGYALIASIIFSVLMLLSAAAFLSLSGGRYGLAINAQKRNQAFYTAEAGLWHAKANLREDPLYYDVTSSEIFALNDRAVTMSVTASDRPGANAGEKKIVITVPY